MLAELKVRVASGERFCSRLGHVLVLSILQACEEYFQISIVRLKIVSACIS